MQTVYGDELDRFQVAIDCTGQDVHFVLKGQFVLGEATWAFRQEVDTLMKNGLRPVSLSLAGLNKLDSAGLGELVNLSAIAHREDRRIRLTDYNARVIDVLRLCALISHYDVDGGSAGAQSALKAPTHRFHVVDYVNDDDSWFERDERNR